RESRMDEQLMDLVEREAPSDQACLFLRLLRQTGARPIELREATHDRYHDGWIIHPWRGPGYVWKCAKATQQDRVIFTPPEIRPILDGLHKPRERGPLLLTKQGRKWTQNNLTQLWRRLLERKPVAGYLREHNIRREDVTPYSYRHSFISDW